MNWKSIASLAAAMFLAACAATSSDGDSSSAAESEAIMDAGVATDGVASDATATDAGPAVATYAEEAPVIAQRCGACHGTKFNTIAKVTQNRTKMVQELQQQKMPKDNPSWSTTPDGETLLDFLENSPELN